MNKLLVMICEIALMQANEMTQANCEIACQQMQYIEIEMIGSTKIHENRNT